MSKLPDWLNVILAAIVIIGGVIGGWQLMGQSISEANAKIVELERRVLANENYDGLLQENQDGIKERVVRNEANIKHISSNLESLADSMKSIASDIKETNRLLNEVMIEQARQERLNG